jgi:cation transport regulator ChaC
VRQGEGVRGRCIDYVANTVSHLDALGLRESHLHDLLEAARS